MQKHFKSIITALSALPLLLLVSCDGGGGGGDGDVGGGGGGGNIDGEQAFIFANVIAGDSIVYTITGGGVTGNAPGALGFNAEGRATNDDLIYVYEPTSTYKFDVVARFEVTEAPDPENPPTEVPDGIVANRSAFNRVNDMVYFLLGQGNNTASGSAFLQLIGRSQDDFTNAEIVELQNLLNQGGADSIGVSVDDFYATSERLITHTSTSDFESQRQGVMAGTYDFSQTEQKIEFRDVTDAERLAFLSVSSGDFRIPEVNEAQLRVTESPNAESGTYVHVLQNVARPYFAPLP